MQILNPDTFKQLRGSPYDNAALAAVLNAKNSIDRNVVYVDNFVTDADLAQLKAGVKVDITYAYNLATRATEQPWKEDMQYRVIGSRYPAKVNGTIYVRTGQVLDGNNTFWDCTINNNIPRIKLGWSLVAGTPTADPAGPVPGVCNLKATGGAASYGFIDVESIPGFWIDMVNLTSAGTGIRLVACGDGVISNIWLDQGLNGIVIQGAQNLCITNVDTYLINYVITFVGYCQSIAMSSLTINYTMYAGIYLFGGSQPQNITIGNFTFDQNAQFGLTFAALILQNSNGGNVQFSNGCFRNWYQWCIDDSTGVGAILEFSNCVFDGLKTNPLYNDPSTTAKVLRCGYGSYSFSDCVFRNLYGPIADLNANTVLLKFDGGNVVNCPEDRFLFTNGAPNNITVRNVTGFAFYKANANYQMWVLPWWGPSCNWDFTVTGNPSTGGDARYSRSAKGIMSLSFGYDGVDKYVYCDYTNTWKTPTLTIPADLTVAACLGNTQGGAVKTNVFASSGKACISVAVATADASNFKLAADTSY